jgi:hypothetical protein
MGGSDAPPPPPGPSASEVALQTSQKELLDLQRKQIEKSAKEQELLAPILYKSLGIEPQYDDKGAVVGYKEGALAERKRGIESMFLDRSEAALKGELPINPALTRDLDEQEGTLRERLYKQLGPGWETSTPGIEALANFNKRKSELFDASRRGDLTLAESLGLAREGAGLNTFGATMSAGNRFLPTAQGAASGAAGYGGAAQALASNRLAEYSGSLQSYQIEQQNNPWAGVFGGVGRLAGSLGSAALFKYSDLRLKDIHKRVGETDEGIPLYLYTRKDTGETEVGPVAQEVAQVKPEAVEKFGDYFAVDYARL